MALVHKNCGGEVIEDRSRKPYEYVSEESRQVELHYPIVCQKCGAEILGDDQLEDVQPI